MSSGSIKNNNEDFMKNCLTLVKCLNLAKREIQKNNFIVISKLVSNLFEHRDKESYMGISETIISFLSLSDKKNRNSGYLNSNIISFNNLDNEFKQIMKKEFAETIRDLRNSII